MPGQRHYDFGDCEAIGLRDSRRYNKKAGNSQLSGRKGKKVSGLYHRAIEYLQARGQLRLVRDDDPDDEFDGTPEERAEIEQEIQRAVDANRMPVDAGTLEVTAERRGGTLPLIVNLIAILIMAAGVLVLTRVFANQEAGVVSESTAIASAEGRLISQLREESEAELAEKQSEIAQIEQRLLDVESEREQIRETTEAQLASQEDALRVEFESALQAERDRLAELGISADEQSALLEQFQADQEAALAAEINAVRAEAEARLAEQEAALEALESEFQASLNQVELERTALQEELVAREAELEAQFAAREAELSSEAQEAASLLQELQSEQESRQLILDQLLGFYTQIRTSLAAGEFTGARGAIESMRSYLQTGPIANIPELQRRRQVELFLVDTLQDQLDRAESAQSADATSLVESATLLAEVGELVSQAQGSFESGNLTQARELYIGAISQIPAVELGYSRIVEIEASLAEQDAGRVAELITNGNVLYLQGEFQAAADQYGQAIASLPGENDALLSRLLDAGYQLLSVGDRAELATLRDSLAAANQENTLLQSRVESLEDEIAGARTLLTQEQARIAALNEDLEQTDSDLRDAQSAIESLSGAEARATELGARLAATTAELASTNEIVAALEAQLEAAAADPGSTDDVGESDLAAARAALTVAESDLASVRQELAATQSLLAAAEAELAAARDQGDTAESELLDQESALTSALSRLETSQAALATAEGELTSTRAELDAALEDFALSESSLADREAELAGAREELEEVTAQLAVARSDLEAAQAALSEATGTDVADAIASAREEDAAAIAELQQALQISRTEASSLQDQIMTLQGRLDEQRAIVADIESFQAAFAGLPEPPGLDLTSLELLETKLLILRIVNSDAIRADNPELADQLNDYLDALVVEQRAIAARDTVDEINALLDEIRTTTTTTVADTTRLTDQYPLLAGLTGDRRVDLLSRLRQVADPAE